MLQNEMKDLTFEVSNLVSPSLSFFKSISYEGPNIYNIHKERRSGGLATYRMFTDSVVFK